MLVVGPAQQDVHRRIGHLRQDQRHHHRKTHHHQGGQKEKQVSPENRHHKWNILIHFKMVWFSSWMFFVSDILTFYVDLRWHFITEHLELKSTVFGHYAIYNSNHSNNRTSVDLNMYRTYIGDLNTEN